MSYCQECGAKMKEGDIFCTNCGAKQNQSFSNQQIPPQNYVDSNAERANYTPSDSYKTSRNQINFSEQLDVLMKMLLKPVTGAKQFVTTAEKRTVIGMTLLFTVMQGVLGVWKVNQIISSFENLAVQLIQKIIALMNIIQPSLSGNLMDSKEIVELTTEINRVKALINIPYSKIFLQNCGMFLITIAILFIIIYIGSNILSKDRKDVFVIYKAALIISVPTLYFQLFSIIVSYLSFYVGLAVGIIGIIVSLGCLIVILKENLDVDENNCVFIGAVSFIAVCIALSICLQKIIVTNMSDIIMSVTNIMKTIK